MNPLLKQEDCGCDKMEEGGRVVSVKDVMNNPNLTIAQKRKNLQIPSFQQGGPTFSPIYRDTLDFYNRNKSSKKNGKDFFSNIPENLEGMNYAVKCDVEQGDGSNCIARANETVDQMMPGSTFFESGEATKKKLGVEFSTDRIPTAEEKEKYVHFKTDSTFGSFDSWDVLNAYEKNAPKNVVFGVDKDSRDPEKNKTSRVNFDGYMKNYKGKVPLGSFINVGEHWISETERGPSHTLRVVGFKEDGEPLVADHGNIVPLSGAMYMDQDATSIYNITSVPGKEKYTFDHFTERNRDFNRPNDVPYIKDFSSLPLNSNGEKKYVNASKDFIRMHDDLVQNKNKVIAATGMSGEDYDRYAKATLALSGQETQYGNSNLYNLLESTPLKKSKGVSSLRLENIKEKYKDTLGMIGEDKATTVGNVLYASDLVKQLKTNFKAEGQEDGNIEDIGFRMFRQHDNNLIKNSVRGRKPIGYVDNTIGKDRFIDEKIDLALPRKGLFQSKESYKTEVNDLLQSEKLDKYSFDYTSRGDRAITKRTDGNKIKPSIENLMFYGWQQPSAIIGGDADGNSQYFKNNVANYEEIYGEKVPQKQKGGILKTLIDTIAKNKQQSDVQIAQKGGESGKTKSMDYHYSEKDIGNFYKTILDSSWYKERIQKNYNGFLDDKPDEIIAERKNNLEKVNDNVYLERGVGSFYSNNLGTKERKINLDPDEVNESMSHPRTVLSHEYSHGVTDNGLNRYEKNLFTDTRRNLSEHVSEPNEAKADIDAMRYNLYKAKQFNPKTGQFKTKDGKFNPSLLNFIKNDTSTRRMRKTYKDQDLVNIFNTVASNQSEKEPIYLSQKGGETTTDLFQKMSEILKRL